ncbi:MAG: DUF2924 domain-containing protein [Alphaproteobacteria bacterium]
MAVLSKRVELVAAWQNCFGCPPPKGIGQQLLSLGIAYHEQCRRHGGPKPSTKKRLEALATGTPKPTPVEAKACAKKLMPGARLVRDWRGDNHIVSVMEKGFLYDGKTYGSLSEIARTITGARWSGPRFFGIPK